MLFFLYVCAVEQFLENSLKIADSFEEKKQLKFLFLSSWILLLNVLKEQSVHWKEQISCRISIESFHQ